MSESLKGLFSSKKFLAALAASVFTFIGLRYDMSVKEILLIISPLGLYIPSQGLADFSKEAAKVNKE